MRRGFRASKLANNPINEADKIRLAAEAVAQLPGATTNELLAIADPRFTPATLRTALSRLAKRGEILAVKQPDGPYCVWSSDLAPPSSRISAPPV